MQLGGLTETHFPRQNPNEKGRMRFCVKKPPDFCTKVQLCDILKLLPGNETGQAF